MPDFLQLVSMLREQMHASLSRSDVLRPLAWLVLILTTGTLTCVLAKAPEWLLISMAVLLFLSIVLYIISYLYCLFNDRDALRSEKYSLHKMAIEHGMYGDSQTGLIEPDKATVKAITNATPATSEEQK